MQTKIDLGEELATLPERWSQRVVARANGQLYKVARGRGRTRWHRHPDQDELFLVVEGRLIVELRDREVELDEGEMYVVPRGVEHRPRAEEEAGFLIVGSTVTSNADGGKPEPDG